MSETATPPCTPAVEDTVPADLANAFKAAMRRLAATVTVVTTGTAEARHGMTATAVTSVTMNPPALLVCVNQSASLHPVMATGTRFCINLLHTRHADVASAFGGKLTGPDRFKSGAWSQNEYEVPYLIDAQANLFCRVDALMLYGTHTIFVGRVDEVRLHGEIAPLIYQDGRYVMAS